MKKEERKKQARSNKQQGKATQQTQGVTFPKLHHYNTHSVEITKNLKSSHTHKLHDEPQLP